MDYTLNIHGRLLSLATPQVMGILNATPDSFFAGSRTQAERDIAERAVQMAEEGAAIIDVGACSTRPGAMVPDEEEETDRLRRALSTVRRELPDMVLSVDTFRPDIARMAVEEYGVGIVNDVSEGGVTGASGIPLPPMPEGSVSPMFRMVAHLHVPYILMSVQPDLRQTLLSLSAKVQQLRDMGQADIIIDPGFGFGKTVEENYALLAQLDRLQVLGLPLLVGVSRKSMITRPLGITAEEALCPTTALHAVTLMKGASILRVHDVRNAVECCKMMQLLSHQTPPPCSSTSE